MHIELSLHIEHLQLLQTMFRGFCSAAASNQLAKQKGGVCIYKDQADTNCIAKLQLPSLGLNAITVHDVLCRALQHQLEVCASACLHQLWHALEHVLNHWFHNLFKVSRVCCCTMSSYKPVNLVLHLTDLRMDIGIVMVAFGVNLVLHLTDLRMDISIVMVAFGQHAVRA